MVVGRTLECEAKQALLLQVRLVDPGKAPGDHGHATQQSWRKGGVFPTTALAIVCIADDDPFNTLGLVVTRDLRDWPPAFSRKRVPSGKRVPDEFRKRGAANPVRYTW